MPWVARGDRRELLGEEARRQLVGETGRVVERAELAEPAGDPADLLDELAPGAVLQRLAGHVELAGRDLEDLPVEGAAILEPERRRHQT